MKNKVTVIQQVRAALLNGDRLTALLAWERWELMHLASTVRQLRADGMAINSQLVKTPNGKHVACYWLET